MSWFQAPLGLYALLNLLTLFFNMSGPYKFILRYLVHSRFFELAAAVGDVAQPCPLLPKQSASNECPLLMIITLENPNSPGIPARIPLVSRSITQTFSGSLLGPC